MKANHASIVSSWVAFASMLASCTCQTGREAQPAEPKTALVFPAGSLEEGFRAENGKFLEVVASFDDTIHLHHWGATPVRVIRAKVLSGHAPARIHVKYHYVRKAVHEEDRIVELGVWVDILEDKTARTLTWPDLHTKFAVQVHADDFVEIPVLLRDAWGERGDIVWSPPTVDELEPPRRDAACPPGVPQPDRTAGLAPHLVRPKLLCGEILRRNLISIPTRSVELEAASAGSLMDRGLAIQVLEAGQPLVGKFSGLLHSETYPSGGGSHGELDFDSETPLTLQPGDRVTLDAK